jgi:hypothetical protein
MLYLQRTSATSDNHNIYITTEDQRKDQAVDVNRLRYLIKFTSDTKARAVNPTGQNTASTGSIYTYGQNQSVKDRFTKLQITESTTNTSSVFTGEVSLTPSGFWMYEVYEVSYSDTVPVTLDENNSPITESDTANNTGAVHGTVKGLVESGKLFIEEAVGDEEVQYIHYTESTQNNYIYTQ